MWSGGSDVDRMFVRLAEDTIDDLLARTRSSHRARRPPLRRPATDLSPRCRGRRHVVPAPRRARRGGRPRARPDRRGRPGDPALRLIGEKLALGALASTVDPLVANPGTGVPAARPRLRAPAGPVARLRAASGRSPSASTPRGAPPGCRGCAWRPRSGSSGARPRCWGPSSTAARRRRGAGAVPDPGARRRRRGPGRPSRVAAGPTAALGTGAATPGSVERLYAARLWATLDEPMGPDAVLAPAEEDLDRMTRRSPAKPSGPSTSARPSRLRTTREPSYAARSTPSPTQGPVDDATVLALCQRRVRHGPPRSSASTTS